MKKAIILFGLFICFSNGYAQFKPVSKPLDFNKVVQNMDSIFKTKSDFKIDLNLNLKNLDFRKDLVTTAFLKYNSDNNIYHSNTYYSNSISMNNIITNDMNYNILTPNGNLNFRDAIFIGALNLIFKK